MLPYLRRATLAAFLLPLLLGALLGVVPSPAQAIGLVTALDPTQSSITSGAGSAALSGSLGLEVGQLPVVGSSTSFDVGQIAVQGGGLNVSLDPSLANPGLGLLRADGTFLIPSLFLSVEGLDGFSSAVALTVLGVEGTFGLSGACDAGLLCLETSFQIDTLGPEGILDVAIVAQVPEPTTGLLLLLGLGGLAAGRRGETIR